MTPFAREEYLARIAATKARMAEQGIDLLRRQKGASSQADPLETLEQMDQAVSRADQIIEGLMHFTKPPLLHLKITDLNRAISSALALLQKELYLKKIVGNHPFILVTSAYHMPRAMALFTAQHMHPIPAPTQFIGLTQLSIKTVIPNASSLFLSDLAIHEYLGLWWAKINKFI